MMRRATWLDPSAYKPTPEGWELPPLPTLPGQPLKGQEGALAGLLEALAANTAEVRRLTERLIALQEGKA